MHVVSLAPVPVSSLTWRRGAGPWTKTVVCKLTFRLEPGEAQLAKRHDPIYEREKFPDDDLSASLYAPCDLVPTRPSVDVTLVGSAYAPRGEPVATLPVRLALASIDKALQIDAVGSAERSGAFKSAALGYEYAAPTADNPASAESARAHHRIGAPSGRADLAFAGFGPIAQHWPLRDRLRRGQPPPEHDEGGAPQRLHEALDLAFFNAAPPDQRLIELRPNAELRLENLHPDHPRLRCRLPNVSPQIFVERKRSRRVALETQIRSLWIDTRRSIMAASFLVEIPLEHPEQEGRVYVAVAGAGRRLSAGGLDKLIGSLGASSASSSAGTDDPDDEPTNDESGDDVLGRTVSVRPRASAEETQTSLLSKEHIMERTVDPQTALELKAQQAESMPRWMKTPSGPPPPPRRASMPASELAAARSPAVTHPGIGPAAWKRTPDQLADTSSLPKLDEAAPPAPRSLVRPPEPSLPPVPTSAPELAPTPAPEPRPKKPSEVVELLWYDDQATPLLRKRFRALCDELDFAPRDDRHDLPDDDPKRARDHHIHFGVLVEAPLVDHVGLRRALREAVGESGRFTPPLVVLRGGLRMTFAELDVLRVTAAVLEPISGDDKKLRATLDQVAELSESPLLSGSTETVKSFTDQLRKLYREGRRSLSLEYLEDAVERVLLEQRRYARRKLFGGEVLRAVFTLEGETRSFAAYLPESLGERLPMMAGFPARLVAEAHVKQDQFEPSPHALRIVSLGRVIKVED